MWNKLSPKYGFFALSICFLFIIGFSTVEGAEWKLFRAVPTGNVYYYDSTNIKHFPNGVVWVWVRIIETTRISEEKLQTIKKTKKPKDTLQQAQQESTGEWRELFEINCSSGMARVLSATSYDTQGKIRDDYEGPSEWGSLSPNSVTNYLTEFVCRGSRIN